MAQVEWGQDDKPAWGVNDVAVDPPATSGIPELSPPGMDWAGMPELAEKVGRQTGAEFNRGLAGMADFPVTLVNLTAAGIFAADRKITEALFGRPSTAGPTPQMTMPFTELGKRSGLIPEERAEGNVPRAFEFMGASVLPGGVTLKAGERALASLSPVPSVLEQMGRATASAPGKATAYDIAASFTAATGGGIAREFTDNEAVIALAELGFAFVPSALALTPQLLTKWTLSGKVHDKVLEVLAPYTKKGGMVAASKRMQDIAQDPQAAAAAIDPESPLPPAQQTADPGLIKLQNMILKKFPKVNKKFSDDLNHAIEQLTKNVDFGGDTQRARHLLNIRSQIAVEEAADAVSRLGPNATPRQISMAARKSVQKALNDSSVIENYLWEKLDLDAPADVVTARQVLNDEISVRSPDADPEDIPKWLTNRLNEQPIDDRTMAYLKQGGYVAADGSIDPAIRAALKRQGVLKDRQRTLNDVKTLRGRVLQAIRVEKGELSPNRNKLRILGDVQEGLLDDMAATGVDGVDDARAFSAAINERYRRGRVGRLLGFDKTGAERVDPADVLNDVVYGPHSATNTQKFTEMANEAPEQTLSFLKAKYIESVYDDELQRISKTAHKAFIKNLEKTGLTEIFPELKAELNNVYKKGMAARELNVPDSQVNTTTINKQQSRAALLLQSNPGEEMKLILKSNHPVAAAREIMQRMMPRRLFGPAKPDKVAVQGLKTSLAQELLDMSGGKTVNAAGEMVPDGKNLKALIKQYDGVMRAFDMTDAEIQRFTTIAEQIRLGQLGPGDVDIGTTVMAGGLARPIDILARVIGARLGGKIGQESMGGSLQTAGIMSKEGRERILQLTTSTAEELIIQAIDDPKLYRALLLGPRATMEAQRNAAKALDDAILRIESAGTTALAVGATQDFQP
jgi:hypothetical protein